jgi:hypothetical protein
LELDFTKQQDKRTEIAAMNCLRSAAGDTFCNCRANGKVGEERKYKI